MESLRHVKGLDALDKLLQQVAPKVERNALRGALRAGANVILPVARGNIHSVSGVLARSLKVRSGARGGEVTAKVYTKVFYANMVEYGTRAHRIEPLNREALSIGGGVVESVEHPGARPRPFLRPAMDTQATAAVIRAAEYMKRRLSEKNGLDTSDIVIEEEE